MGGALPISLTSSNFLRIYHWDLGITDIFEKSLEEVVLKVDPHDTDFCLQRYLHRPQT